MGSNPVPLIVTVEPTAPDAGERLVIAGCRAKPGNAQHAKSGKRVNNLDLEVRACRFRPLLVGYTWVMQKGY